MITRDAKRTHLAFAAKDAKPAAAQVVQLNSATGASLVKKITYRVPISVRGDVVPVGSIRFMRAKVEGLATRVSLTRSPPRPRTWW